MCNLSLGVEERAKEKVRKEIIENYLDDRRSLHTSIDEIKRDLKVLFKLNPDEIEEYLSSLNN